MVSFGFETITNSIDMMNDLEKIISNPYWNIILLAIAWALTLTTSTLLTTIGPLSAVELGASDSLAAFTVGVFLIGAAISSVPSAWLFRTQGRLVGFSLGCLFQCTGSAFGSLAIAGNSLALLYMGCLFIGLGQGLGQFYRFSAVEISPPKFKSRAITYVLAGGIFAAFLGPESAQNTIDLINQPYQGSFLIVALVGILNQVTIMMVRFPSPPPQSIISCCYTYDNMLGNESKHELIGQINSSSSNKSNKNVVYSAVPTTDSKSLVGVRSTYEIVTEPAFIMSCAVATLAHTIMVMLMSNVTLQMNLEGYSFTAASLVLELHFFAMFAPGFITGKLIQSYGSLSIAISGGILFAVSSAVLAIGNEEWNFIAGMILVGVAWNLSFSAGTVMLTSTYKPVEATKVQAINDFILFTVAGAGSLGSGYMFSDLGWLVLIYFVSGMMGVYLVLFFIVRQLSFKPPSEESFSSNQTQMELENGENDDRTEIVLNGNYPNNDIVTINKTLSPFQEHASNARDDDDGEDGLEPAVNASTTTRSTSIAEMAYGAYNTLINSATDMEDSTRLRIDGFTCPAVRNSVEKSEVMAERIQLEQQIEEMNKEVERLRLENSILLNYNEKKTVELGVDEEEKKKKKSKRNLVTTLTSDQKFEIANIVHEDLLNEIESTRKSSEKMIDTLRAVLEETEIRIGELKRDAYEFKRDVVVGAENSRTGKIMAERVIRYFDDKFKQTDAVIEKLRLKNSTLKSQINKIETTLAQKEEIGDVLHYIDFHQLQIENKQYVTKIEERNDELLAVKISTSKTIQALNEYKHRLNLQMEDANWLKNELINKKSQLLKLGQELKKVTKEVVVEKRASDKLRLNIEESAGMPEVEDYILQKKEVYTLENILKTWQKKVEIMEMAAKRSRSLTSKTSKY